MSTKTQPGDYKDLKSDSQDQEITKNLKIEKTTKMKKKNLKNKKKGSSTSKTTQGAQKTPNFYNLYKRYSKQDKITEYFENPRYEPYHYVSYLELLEIIGEDPQRSQFPSIRKNILKIHCEYQNAALDTLYKYIYTPLALRSLYCLATKKTPSFFIHLGATYFGTKAFSSFAVFYLSLIPAIHFGQFTDFLVCKKEGFEERGAYIERYFKCLENREIKDYSKLPYLRTGVVNFMAFCVNRKYLQKAYARKGLFVDKQEMIEKEFRRYLERSFGYVGLFACVRDGAAGWRRFKDSVVGWKDRVFFGLGYFKQFKIINFKPVEVEGMTEVGGPEDFVKQDGSLSYANELETHKMYVSEHIFKTEILIGKNKAIDEFRQGFKLELEDMKKCMKLSYLKDWTNDFTIYAFLFLLPLKLRRLRMLQFEFNKGKLIYRNRVNQFKKQGLKVKFF